MSAEDPEHRDCENADERPLGVDEEVEAFLEAIEAFLEAIEASIDTLLEIIDVRGERIEPCIDVGEARVDAGLEAVEPCIDVCDDILSGERAHFLARFVSKVGVDAGRAESPERRADGIGGTRHACHCTRAVLADLSSGGYRGMGSS